MHFKGKSESVTFAIIGRAGIYLRRLALGRFPDPGFVSLLGTATFPLNADRYRDRHCHGDHSGDSDGDKQHRAPPFRLNAGIPARLQDGPVRLDATCTSFRTSAAAEMLSYHRLFYRIDGWQSRLFFNSA
jgi:hypothetical protein